MADAQDAFREEDARFYDERLAQLGDTDEAVACLGELAGGGPVLELGVGTGRVAIPLAHGGIAVHGIDLSESMLTRLRSKPGGDHVAVTVGDFAEVEVTGTFKLVFVVFDTLTALPSQDDQVRCFVNVARHLDPEGVFLVEGSIPPAAPPSSAAVRQAITVKALREDGVHLEISLHDPSRQLIAVQWVRLEKQGCRLFPFTMRYAWPAELDLMARVAGLRLRDRWGGWARQPFTGASTRHVSVYARADR